MFNFNATAFLEDAKKVHLEVEDTLPTDDIRGKLEDFIDYDRSLFSKSLDDICTNVVGNTMFRLLMTKLPPGKRLRIIKIGPEQTHTGDQLVDQAGSSYSHETQTVNINLNVYGRSGIGILARQYYCVDESGNITLKRKSIPSSLFHEFTHCLHHIEDLRKYARDRHFAAPEPRTSKEELRTISG